jgi:hypothetical protein
MEKEPSLDELKEVIIAKIKECKDTKELLEYLVVLSTGIVIFRSLLKETFDNPKGT